MAKVLLLVDTREQRPFEWKGVPTRRVTLPVGDYSVPGMEGECGLFVERKALPDLWSTVAVNRNILRFEAELLKARTLEARLWIVAECSPSAVMMGSEWSNMSGTALLDRAHELCFTYGASLTFGGSREGAALLTLSILRSAQMSKARG